MSYEGGQYCKGVGDDEVGVRVVGDDVVGFDVIGGDVVGRNVGLCFYMYVVLRYKSNNMCSVIVFIRQLHYIGYRKLKTTHLPSSVLKLSAAKLLV